jgi:hypothetical protein
VTLRELLIAEGRLIPAELVAPPRHNIETPTLRMLGTDDERQAVATPVSKGWESGVNRDFWTSDAARRRTGGAT